MGRPSVWEPGGSQPSPQPSTRPPSGLAICDLNELLDGLYTQPSREWLWLAAAWASDLLAAMDRAAYATGEPVPAEITAAWQAFSRWAFQLRRN